MRSTIRVRSWARTWAGLLAVSAGAIAYGLFVTPEVFRLPIYQPMQAIASLWAWGWLWAGVAVAAVTTAISAWPHPWAVAKVGAMSGGAAWLVCLSWGHWIDGHPIAWTGWALWWWMVASHIVVLTSRAQFRGVVVAGHGGDA